MKGFIKAGTMVVGILVAIGCQRNIPDQNEGAEITGSDPDNIPVYPRDVHGTVTFSAYPMNDLTVYLYDANDEIIDTLRFQYEFHNGQWSQYYDFCRKNINAYGHPYPWFVCVEAFSAVKPEPDVPAYNCSAPIFSYSFAEENCDPERPSAHRDIAVSWNHTGYCTPNPCGF